MTHTELDRYIHEELNINWFPHTLEHVPGHINPPRSDEQQHTWVKQSFRWYQPNAEVLIIPNPQTAAPPHDHGYFEVMYVYEGAVTHSIAGGKVTVPAGSAFIVPPAAEHGIDASEGSVSFNIILPQELVQNRLLQRVQHLLTISACFGAPAAWPEGLLLRSEPSSRAGFYFRELLCQTYDPDAYAGDIIEMLLPLFFTELERSGGNAAPNHSQRGIDDDLDRVLQYIDANYASATLSEAASRFGYTAGYISKALKRATGQSFSQLRQSRCILRAAVLLASEPARSVTSIAEEVGIGNITQFYRLFDQQFHMTPKAYRKERAGASPSA